MFILWGVCLPNARAGELRIRKELVIKQADRALITATGRFDHVKDHVNSLDADCDLHAPVRVKEIKVAVVAEFMNACSTGIDPNEVKALTEDADAEIDGVFRIWFEHPGSKTEVLTEEEPLAPYKSSNPPHAVEIHPIVRVGQRKFIDTVREIEKSGKVFKAKGPKQLQSLLNRRVSIQEFDGSDGEPYISIESGCCLPNYFRLEAAMKSAPKKTADGFRALINIVDGQKTIAQNLRIFSIDGTQANTTFKKLKVGSKFSFWGITRMDGSEILKLVDENAEDSIHIPIEFVLLAVEK